MFGNLLKYVSVVKHNLSHSGLVVKVEEGKGIGVRFEIPFYGYFCKPKILQRFEDYENANPGIKKILSIRTPYNYMARMYQQNTNQQRDMRKVPIFKENWKQCAQLVLDEPKTYHTILYDKFVLSDDYKRDVLKAIFNYEGELKSNNWRNSARDNSSFLERWKKFENNEGFRKIVLEDQELKDLSKSLYDDEILKSLPI
ncbi:MAG: hypothetical protein GTO02_01810 [Candidatus Dadabacteria bacterium]|nr:hypothetical protein [Candidatus Dadabacteria bacterium]